MVGLESTSKDVYGRGVNLCRLLAPRAEVPSTKLRTGLLFRQKDPKPCLPVCSSVAVQRSSHFEQSEKSLRKGRIRFLSLVEMTNGKTGFTLKTAWMTVVDWWGGIE